MSESKFNSSPRHSPVVDMCELQAFKMVSFYTNQHQLQQDYSSSLYQLAISCVVSRAYNMVNVL